MLVAAVPGADSEGGLVGIDEGAREGSSDVAAVSAEVTGADATLEVAAIQVNKYYH